MQFNPNSVSTFWTITCGEFIGYNLVSCKDEKNQLHLCFHKARTEEVENIYRFNEASQTPVLTKKIETFVDLGYVSIHNMDRYVKTIIELDKVQFSLLESSVSAFEAGSLDSNALFTELFNEKVLPRSFRNMTEPERVRVSKYIIEDGIKANSAARHDWVNAVTM